VINKDFASQSLRTLMTVYADFKV